MTSLHLASKKIPELLVPNKHSFLGNWRIKKWNIVKPCHRHPEEYYTEQWMDTKMMNEMLSGQINKQTYKQTDRQTCIVQVFNVLVIV